MDFVLLIKAAIMGVVEGLTEFLPISSTGHLILAGSLLGFHDDKAKVFDIAIQTGAIFAVILVYWQKVWGTLVALPTQREARRFAVNVFIGFLPAVVLGLLFGKLIQTHLFTPTVVATTFILGGFVILWAEGRHRPRTQHDHPADLARIHHVENMVPTDRAASQYWREQVLVLSGPCVGQSVWTYVYNRSTQGLTPISSGDYRQYIRAVGRES